MKHSDIETLMRGAAPVIRDYLERATAPLIARIVELEKQIAAIPAGRDGADGKGGAKGDTGEPGSPGRDGKDGLAGRGVAKLFVDAKGHLIVTYTDGGTDDVGRIVGERGEPGADGKDGRNGADGLPGKDGEIGPQGEKGVPGEKGIDGQNGIDGKDGPSGEKGDPGLNGKDGMPGRDGEKGIDGAPGLDGKDGRDGIDGKPGDRGEKGEPGQRGEMGPQGQKGDPGSDGVGLADAMVDRDGKLILTMTDGRHKALGIIVGRDGKDGEKGADGAAGRDGVDGLGFDDLTVEHDGERGFTLKFVRGDNRKEFSFDLPVAIYRGVFELGRQYVKGDVVTWAGSTWHCDKPSADKPGDDNDAWTLAVKRGRDAKEPVNLKGGT